LIMLGVCKHGIRQIPVGYSLMMWSMVYAASRRRGCANPLRRGAHRRFVSQHASVTPVLEPGF
jgi:hypothetical protein